MQCEELLQRYQQGERNFVGSQLTGVSLRDADIHGINLAGSDLNGSNLRGVDMAKANLQNAQVQFVDLTNASLRGADLTGTNLTGAILRGANLQDTNLQDAVLDVIRRDLYQYLDHVPQEVEGLLETVRAGRVDGGMYASPCACLAGTCERLRKQHGASKTELQDVVDLRDPNSSRERWFLAIIQGDVPQSSPIAAITVQWLEEWLAARKSAAAVNFGN